MSSAPRFPTVASGYDPDAVDAFVIRLVDKARSEIDGLRSYVADLEATLQKVAVSQWQPGVFDPVVDEPDPAGSDVATDDVVADDPVGDDPASDTDGDEAVEDSEVDTPGDGEESDDERRERIATLVEARIRGRRLSTLTND